MAAMLRWMRTHIVPAVVGAAVGIALPMVLFREAHWSWLPQSDTDQWAVAGVLGVVLGGVMTEWSSRARPQESDEADGPDDGGQAATGSGADGDTIRIGRTGRATATGGGEASTGVRGVGRGTRIRVRRTGDARAQGPGSKASTGVDHGPQQ